MADIWDSANLRRKLLNKLRRPATDEDLLEPDGVTDATWDLLSEAQDYWFNIIASTRPEPLYGAPVQLTTADSGLTYTFGTDVDGSQIFPIGHVEIRESRNGRVLIPTADWGSGDYVMEGDRIRTPNGKAKTYSAGPWARFVAQPTRISATVQPVLMPRSARVLIVLRAAINWANQGGLRDPSPWEREEAAAWGTIANALATQFFLSGAQAVDDGDDNWWSSVDSSSWYTRYNG